MSSFNSVLCVHCYSWISINRPTANRSEGERGNDITATAVRERGEAGLEKCVETAQHLLCCRPCDLIDTIRFHRRASLSLKTFATAAKAQ